MIMEWEMENYEKLYKAKQELWNNRRHDKGRQEAVGNRQ
jgi:hypothetical protein